ncbi:MAG: hypothetical protein ACE5FK_08935, partial [Candidatus Methylomirabilia bacterium]
MAHPEPIPGPVQRLGIHRIHHHATIEQEIHHAPLGLCSGYFYTRPLGELSLKGKVTLIGKGDYDEALATIEE